MGLHLSLEKKSHHSKQRISYIHKCLNPYLILGVRAGDQINCMENKEINASKWQMLPQIGCGTRMFSFNL